MNFTYSIDGALDFIEEITEDIATEICEYVFENRDLKILKNHKDFEDIESFLNDAKKEYKETQDLPDDIDEIVYDEIIKGCAIVNLDREREKEQENQDDIWKTDRAYEERKRKLEDNL